MPLLVRMLYTGVPLFFCISAFSLCIGYHGKLQTGAQIATFFKRRWLRIAPLFYVLCVVWVLILSYLWQSWKIPGLSDALLNLTFLFNLVPGNNGLTPGGWSMSVEFLFYLAFPLMVFAIRGIWTAVVALVLSVACAALAGGWLHTLAEGYSWYSVVMQLPYFLSGILLFAIYERMKGDRKAPAIALPLVGLTIIALGAVSLSGLVDVRIWGPHAFALCLMPLVLAFALKPLLVNPVTMFLGKVSYGIYLIHPAVITMVARPIQDARKDVISQWPMLFVVIGVTFVVTVMFATLSYYLIERPFMDLGRVRRNSRPIAAVPAE